MKRGREETGEDREDNINSQEAETETPRTHIRRRISFIEDSDTEILIDNQAHKKRRMPKEVEELKLYIVDAIKGLSTSKQAEGIINSISIHSNQIHENRMAWERNSREIGEIRNSISNIESVLLGGGGPNSGSGGRMGAAGNQASTRPGSSYAATAAV